MNAIVIEHVPVAELPEAWRQKLGQVADATVTVRIEPESLAQPEDHGSQFADDPLFGCGVNGRIWQTWRPISAAFVHRVLAAKEIPANPKEPMLIDTDVLI